VVVLAVLVAVTGVVVGFAAGGQNGAATARGLSAPGSSASPGCGRTPVPGPTAKAGASADVVQTLTVRGVTRSYRLAVPNRYRPTVPTPLILLFHGSGSNAIQTSLYTQMPRRGARDGYLVATPDAIGGQWDLSVPGADTPDLAYVRALVATLSARYCVDSGRIYTAGISLGSEFAAIVGCTGSDRIAAIGLVAAEFLLRPCSGPRPVIAFHGTADPIVPYRTGGTGVFLPGVPAPGAVQNLTAWAHLDRCSATPRLRQLSSMVVRRSWTGCRGAGEVVLYTVLGGGHTWPGSPITLSAGTFGPTTEQIDATALMLAFFGHHRLHR
jgi:polyhydroxybutyrate depolymerase